MRDTTLGVYVHVPFCERVCPYCDFAVVATGRDRVDPEREARYLAALERELVERGPAFQGLRLDTIYLGGGTPSLLSPEAIGRLVSGVCAAFPGVPEEVTLEVNPSTVERCRLPGFRAAGVTRLSLGIQSFDDRALKRLGRAHRAGEGRETLAAAREAGFTNLSLDLVYAVPGLPLELHEADLREALAATPEHVSTYELTIEPGTPYARGRETGALVPPNPDEVAELVERAGGLLRAGGLSQYEISSHARPGFESRHNRRYWRREPVLGLGVGAWSTEPRSRERPHGARRANPRDLGAYLARVDAGSAPEAPEVLDAATARGEAMFLGLRTREGVDVAAFRREFGAPPEAFYGEVLAELAGRGLLEKVEEPLDDEAVERLRLTPGGRLLADAVAERFV